MRKEHARPRARELGLPFEGETGEFNAITDVPGVEVGFTTLIEGEGAVEVGKGPIRTGVSAILPRGKGGTPSPIWAGHFNLNSNGEMTGTHWIHEAGYFIGTDIPMLPIQLHRVAKRAAIGIGRTGTPGGNYSGDIFLAFSLANEIDLPSKFSDPQAVGALDFTNDHYFDDIYRAVVQAIEEAIVNAMLAAESMTTVKPEGYTLEAIDHDQ